ncbi:MAG: DUF1566 domain-containing protein [Candidatus Electryonea clarkiae]|nr:DUF1566 domain-containing protein [Candidatus Electryonea clarkiae]MDP8288338.1 DUF1566 domain-containing protein [Candidatus Electryonea clarkiae]
MKKIIVKYCQAGNEKAYLKLFVILFSTACFTINTFAQDYQIVDTGQSDTYNNSNSITAPAPEESFYGQDAQFDGNQPDYLDNENGTITDGVTGLMWVQARGEKMSWADAFNGASECNAGDYDDWRMPSIKELYSLILFSGNTGMTADLSTPFLDTDYFDFEYGNEDIGERFIDCQDWTATQYVHFTMMGDSTVFGVNFADGRIKGYPKYDPRTREPHELYVRYVRGNTDYGINDFVDNSDGTVTDNATGLMWTQDDSQEGLNWEDALAWVTDQNTENYLDHNDWRLPNAKELQSIVDYTRAPEFNDSPALDPVFETTELEDGDYPWYWTGTTHHDGGPGHDYEKAVYVCFGRATGWMEVPPESGNFQLLDVHGAGAQRSDFKSGDPDDYPHGHGPQGDIIRINNYVRMVRAGVETSVPDQGGLNTEHPQVFKLFQNSPNPFNPTTSISFDLQEASKVKLKVFNIYGQQIMTLLDESLEPGFHSLQVNLDKYPSGIYFYSLEAGNYSQVKKMILQK